MSVERETGENEKRSFEGVTPEAIREAVERARAEGREVDAVVVPGAMASGAVGMPVMQFVALLNRLTRAGKAVGVEVLLADGSSGVTELRATTRAELAREDAARQAAAEEPAAGRIRR